MTTSPASPATEGPLPRSLQCGYRSKRCEEPRATKLDGSLHQLCEFHRRKANSNQKRLHQRQKLLGKGKKRPLPAGDEAQSPISGAKRARSCMGSPQSAAEPVGGNTFENFAQEDLDILNVLLFDSVCASPSQPAWDWSASVKSEPPPPPIAVTVNIAAADATFTAPALNNWADNADMYTIVL